MKRICIAIVGSLVLFTGIDRTQAESKTTQKNWNATRSEQSRLFPDDATGKTVEPAESSEFFPADRNRAVNVKRVRPVSAVRQELLRNNRPVFPIRTAMQPPPAPPSGASVPPAPQGNQTPGAVAPMTPMQKMKPPGDSGFSGPFEQPQPQLLNVDEVFDESATGCDDCGCDDWCHRHCWLRSTCDMPLRHWYRPVDHGYYYFRPYNFRHIQQHSQLAPILGAKPQAPYETEMFKKFYADVPDIDKFKREDDKPEEDDKNALPQLEDLLDQPTNDTGKPTTKKMPPQPPMPMLKGNTNKKPAIKKPSTFPMKRWILMTQPRTRRFISALVLSLPWLLIGIGELRAADTRPNIIFLLTDDQRYDTLGCNGNAIIHTPHLDALSRAGVNFDRAFVTTSICAPNRACILTGQYAARHGMWFFGKELRPGQLAKTYPALLKQAGYRTGFIGKYGVGRPPGREIFDYNKGFAGQGRFRFNVKGKPRHLTSVMADQAEEFLDGCRAGEPFHLSISFKAPHVQDSPSVKSDQFPYDLSPAIANLYRDIEIPRPATATSEYFDRLPDFLKNSENRSRWAVRYWGEARTQESLKGYYRLISGVDAAVGRIVRKVKNSGFADNTVIIFSSDHGQYLGEYGFAGKWYPHEVSIRIPLIVFDPRLPKPRRGVRTSDFALSIDIAPTILNLAGVKPPQKMQGRSIVPILAGNTPADWRTEYYYEHYFAPPSAWKGMSIPRNEGIRTQRWKYIQYIDSKPLYEELYDLDTDPHETRNLATRPQHAERMRAFRKKLIRMRREAK
eukprot:g12606.t1